MPPKRRTAHAEPSAKAARAPSRKRAPVTAAEAASSTTPIETPVNLFAGMTFALLEQSIGGMTDKEFAKLIRSRGGGVVPASKTWEYGIAGTSRTPPHRKLKIT